MAQTPRTLVISDVEVGNKYGRLLVTALFKLRKESCKRPASMVNCVCDCGETITIPTKKLRCFRSCGCIKREQNHRESKTNLYSLWNTIKTRCYTKSSRQYIHYGGRGIKMCEGILDFLNFKKIIGERPSSSHSVDRKDNDGNYCCGECGECSNNGWMKNIRWATPTEQAQNKRNNVYFMYNGEKVCLAEISRRVGLSYKLIAARINILGWDFNTAISTPKKRMNRYIIRGGIGKNQYST